MRKNQKQKIMAIVALCISVVGLTLGFAAFSNTLTISSSATVTPDSKDFKLVVYGVPSLGEYDQYAAGDNANNYRDNLVLPITKFTSTTTAEPILFRQYESDDIDKNAAKKAVITNGNGTFSIKDISITFSEPGQGAEYYLLLKNEGHYDAYINVANAPTPRKTCEAGEGATPSLVAKACESINLTPYLAMEENGEYDTENLYKFVDERGNIKIPVGGHALFQVNLYYGINGERADGPFSVTWSDLSYTFTTNAQ